MNRKKCRCVTNLTVLASLTCLVALASLTACGDDYANGILDRDAVIRAAEAVTVDAYPNADFVVVDGHIIVHYNADGTATRWEDNFVKILTEKGKQDNQVRGFFFTVPYEQVKVTRMEVIKPDGRVVRISVIMNSRVMVDPTQMDMNIYDPGSKVFGCQVPGLEVGDMVRYVSRLRTVKARMPDTWHDYAPAEYEFPIKHYTYEVLGPKELPLLHIADTDAVPGVVSYTTGQRDGQLLYRWEISDVPMIFPEPLMPDPMAAAQTLRVSTIRDWQTVSRWYWGLCEPHIQATSAEMNEKVAELTEGVTDRQDQIEAIFYWVSQKVRYMGLTTETKSPGYEPHDVRTTFTRKHGVCRDKAALLVAMLRSAGIDANMVLIHTDGKKDSEVPDIYFNHVIVAVGEADGSFQLMDCTNESTRDLLPWYLRDRSYLVASEGGEELATSPSLPVEQDLALIETAGEISETGVLTLRSVIRFNGASDTSMRGYLSTRTPDGRRQIFERIMESLIPGSQLTGFSIEPVDMQDTSKPLTITLELTAGGFLLAGDDCSLLNLPLVGRSLWTIDYVLQNAKLSHRKYPLTMNFLPGFRETFTIQLPEGMARDAILPVFTSTDDGPLAWSKSVRLADDRLVGSSEFIIKSGEITPEQYLQLKDALRRMEYDQRQAVIFPGLSVQAADASAGQAPARPAPAGVFGPDDDIIHSAGRVTYRVADAHNWTERRVKKIEVLTYGGVKDNAELKFYFNPAWTTVRLEWATVTAPDGTVETVGDEEINLMDAAWVATAPRYPAGKTMVVSLPNVQIGSIIEYEIVREYSNHPFFSAFERFADFDPMLGKTVQVFAPASLPLTVGPDVTGLVTTSRQTNGDEVVYEWSLDEHRGLRFERQLPPLRAFMLVVGLSAGQWPSYARQVNETLTAAAADSDAAQDKARQLIEGLTDSDAKVLAVRDFVASNIRLVHVRFDELPLTAITSADRVLADGYGYTADRAVLLAAMLRAAGFSPEFVLAAWRPAVPAIAELTRQCPDPINFFSLLVRVRYDGREVYLNDTDQYAVLGAVYYDQYLGLVLDSGQLITIAAEEGKEYRIGEVFHITLASNGDAVIERTREYYGQAHGSFHRKAAEMSPEMRRRHHQEEMADISQFAKADGDMVTDFESYPGQERLRVTVEDFAAGSGDYLYFTLPSEALHLFLPTTDTREGPIYWASRRRTARVTVDLPEDFSTVLLAPSDVDWQAPADGGTITVRVRQEADPPRLVIDYDIDLKAAIIPAEDYDKLLEIQRLLIHPSRRTIILRRNEP